MTACVLGSGIWGSGTMGDSPTSPMDHLRITFSIDHRNADESLSWHADMSQCKSALLNVEESSRHHVHFTMRYIKNNWVCKEVITTPLEGPRSLGENGSSVQTASDSSK